MNRIVTAICMTALMMAGQIPTHVAAQETSDGEPSEVVQELDIELESSKLHRRQAQQRIDLLDARIKVLQEARRLQLTMESTEAALDEAEEPIKQKAEEERQAKRDSVEFQLERVHTQLEILGRREDAIALRGELDDEDLAELRPAANRLLQLTFQAEKITLRMFDAFEDDREQVGEELANELERIAEEFEQGSELAHLKIDLHWAIAEEDEGAAHEIQREIKAIEQIGQIDTDALKKPPENTPVPIEINPGDLDAVRGWNLHDQIAPFLRRSCLECHDGPQGEGGFDLRVMLETSPLVVQRERWENVIAQIKLRSMPPREADQPSDGERRSVAAWLTMTLDEFDYSTVHQVGREPAKRLSHDEYNHTVRDLFGIDLRPADRFPADMKATSGFDNSANSLFLQPVLMERYLNAADYIVDTALPLKSRSPQSDGAWRKLLLGGGASLEGDSVNPSHQAANLPACEAALLHFAERAYRRPITRNERERFRNALRKRVSDGASANAALRDAIRVVLISPNFLLRTERSGENGAAREVGDWEFANRISYFLWASMPDAELFRVAREGRIRDPRELTRQIDRMLDDPRSETLGRLFASQWLGFVELSRVQRDQIDNPWATDTLVDSMHEESSRLFHSLLAEDQPIDRLVDADYTFVNEELASHYGIDGIVGTQLRRVSLSQTPRRGILGHGSILAVTSFPRRASPVLRGNWILTSLLGTPPPPPPPNVSELDERIAESRRLTPRQKLEMHRQNPNCYTCHSQIDPLGFAMSRFDWFGRYRPGSGKRPMDATGELPSGKTFEGIPGLSGVLVEDHIDDLCEQVSRKMLAYALGRQLEYFDEATVRNLMNDLHENDRRVRSLVHAIIKSDTFGQTQ